MWSSDSEDDDARSDDSFLDDDTDGAIKARLEESLDFPTVCPVCAPCNLKCKRLKTRTALFQHAQEKVRDTSAEMKKIRIFHKQLVQKIEKLNDEDAMDSSQERNGISSVGRGILGKSFTRTVDTIDRLGKDMKEGRCMMNEMETKKVKKQRQSVKVSSTQEEIKHRLRECLQQSKKLQEQKLAEVALYEAKVKELLEKRDDEISAKRAAIASLEKSSKEAKDSLSMDERIENSKKLFALRKECERMENEKKRTEDRLRDHQRKKAEALNANLMQKQEGEEITREKEEKSREYTQTKARVELKVEKEVIQSIAKLGLDDPRLAERCRCCGTKFQTTKTEDTSQKLCKRMILYPCGCTSMCEECTTKRRACRGHGSTVVPLVDAIAFNDVFG